jgi:lipopolysaccharide transport system permease protein
MPPSFHTTSSSVHPVSLLNLVRTLVRNRQLVWQMFKQEFRVRYSGSVLGVLWSFFTPLLQVLAFAFLFSVIMQVRWGTSANSEVNFVVVLFVGMMVHSIFADAVSRAPHMIVGQASYVKKIVFPLEILPVVSLLVALSNACIGLLIEVATNIVLTHALPWTILYLPVVLLPYLLLILGLVYFLAGAGVYLRDISHGIGAVVMLSLFLSPVFYPITSVPASYRPLFYLNPVTTAVEQVRSVVLLGGSPEWTVLLPYLLVALGVLTLGFGFFQKSRNGFADVL